MRRLLLLLVLPCSLLPLSGPRADPGNPAIDARAHVLVTLEALQHRTERRLDEAEFLRMSREPGVVVLDARSAERFAELHVQGAINLAFPDITQAALDELLPDRTTPILIYCNNNFVNEPRAFPSKKISAALNLSTYATLYDYGYRNVYELGPLLDPATTRLPLAGRLAPPGGADRPPLSVAQTLSPERVGPR